MSEKEVITFPNAVVVNALNKPAVRAKAYKIHAPFKVLWYTNFTTKYF